MKIDILRSLKPNVIFLGSHPGIIQSMLDYDYLIKRKTPSIIAIITHGRKQERFFWGESEVTLPVFKTVDDLDESKKQSCNLVVNVQSARRVLSTTTAAVKILPNLNLINIFAEQTPERHSIKLKELCKQRDILIAGPSSVGLLIPGYLKLGAIGGTQHVQLSNRGLLSAGRVAVISTSGGMVNELIHTVIETGHGVSFAIALGGDLYPSTSPAEAFLLAEADPNTERIVYFGELGGTDEYEIASLVDKKQITKEVIAYIAGTVADLFENPPQFGHAKAIAKTYDESAKAKKQALLSCGVIICERFADLDTFLRDRPNHLSTTEAPNTIGFRHHALVVSHISGVRDGDIQLLGRNLLETTQSQSLASLVLSMILGTQVESQKAIDFTDAALKILVDHGPQVSGAINTITSARAGKDLVSSLASGLLTVGPRFGGAINAAAHCWLHGLRNDLTGKEFVESFKLQDGIIPGIGHKKYRLDMPDPRVKMLSQFTINSNGDRYTKFARSVEAVTTAKKGNLILNIDGAIAATMLDILESELNYTEKDLQDLVSIEFFNAIFVLARSVGFTAHYLDQRRHDEGLLRLPDDDARYLYD